MFPKDPLAGVLGLGKNLLPNSEGGPFKDNGNNASAIADAPIPSAAPPITAANPEVMQAELDVARANLAKKSIKQTVFAGDPGFGSGGYKSPRG